MTNMTKRVAMIFLVFSLVMIGVSIWSVSQGEMSLEGLAGTEVG